MKGFLKSKLFSLFIMVTLFATLFATAASADVLFTAQQNYKTDRLGLVKGQNAPTKDVVTGLGGSMGAQVFPYKDTNGKNCVAVCQYAGGDDTVDVYDTDATDWSKPLAEFTSVKNIRGGAALNSKLYVCGYDEAQVASYDIANNYTKVAEIKLRGDNNTANAEAIVAYGNNIYVLVTDANGTAWTTGNYEPAKLYKLNPDTLAVEKTLTLNSKNVDGSAHGAVKLVGNKLYIAAVGGMQHYDGTCNGNSMIEVVDMDSFTSKVLVQNSDLYDICKEKWGIDNWTTDFRCLAVNGQEVYIVSAGWGAYPNPNILYIFKTTLAELEKGNIGDILKNFEFSVYPTLGIDYDSETKLLWTTAAEAGDMEGSLYKYNATAWTKYDDTVLGGGISVWCLTEISEPTPVPGGSSGGGCNTGFGAFALLALLPLAWKRKH